MDNNINNFNNNMNNDINNNMNNNINNNINNNKQTNIYAILGLIFSFFFSLIGLILSIIGLIKSKKLNEGKTLSVIGIIISSIKLIVEILILGSMFILIFSVSSKVNTEIKPLGNVIEQYNKCDKAYNCAPNEDGTYTCYYNNEEGYGIAFEQIICNEEEVQDKINKESEEISGVWKPETILDEFGNEINVSKFYGFLEEGNENKKFELSLSYTSNISYNYLSGYEDENDIKGTYKIENDKIYITNNNNKIDIVDIKYDEDNQVYLILNHLDEYVYLYKDNNIYPE